MRMGERDPWYRKALTIFCHGDKTTVPDVATKCKTRVKVQGLMGKIEEKMTLKYWGLNSELYDNGD